MPDAPKNLAVRNLRAPTAEAIAKIQADEAVPAEDKAWLIAKIEKSGFAGVIVDAHEAFHAGATHVTASITKLFLALLLPLLMMASTVHAAITSSNLVTYASTGGASTNYGAAVLIGTAYIANPPSYLVSDGGVVNTNALIVYVQYGLSTASNTMSTVATYTKSATNATDGVVSPASITLSIYAQTVVVTTNDVAVGTKAIFNR